MLKCKVSLIGSLFCFIFVSERKTNSMCDIPKDEELKRELTNKFKGNGTYDGSTIRRIISESDFKNLRESTVIKPCKVKKGDVIRITSAGSKPRPAVVCKVLKDGTCLYIPLTSTENLHCLSDHSSRFFGEGCFCKTFSVCSEEFAIKNFLGVYDNNKLLNKAIKALKEYINQNL